MYFRKTNAENGLGIRRKENSQEVVSVMWKDNRGLKHGEVAETNENGFRRCL